MKKLHLIFLILFFSTILFGQNNTKYIPDWNSLDQRETPEWFRDAKLGIFIHWGVYSVPSFNAKGEYAEWYYKYWREKREPVWDFHKKVYGEDFHYKNFAKDFKTTFYDPDEWAGYFENSGAKYVILTSKHHDGYCLWGSKHRPGWNVIDNGPGVDIIGTLTDAVRKTSVRMGLYYSLPEWYNPIYEWTNDSPKGKVEKYVQEQMIPQFTDLVNTYKPDIIFADGDWDHTSEVWQSKQILAWLYNHPAIGEYVVVNDRWGKDVNFKRGGYFATEYTTGMSNTSHPWEECRGIGDSFGFNRNESIYEYQTSEDLIRMFVDLVSNGGNLLLNIGPTADGRIPVIMQERLLQMGEWLETNGEGIYETRKWVHQNDGYNVRYTIKKDSSAVYAFTYEWPKNKLNLLQIKPDTGSEIYLLGYDKPLEWEFIDREGTIIHIPAEIRDEFRFPETAAYGFKIIGEPSVLSEAYNIETKDNNDFDKLNFVDEIELYFPEKPGTHYYYTTDGSEPDYNSTKYEAPFKVNKTSTVKYFVQAGGKVRSITRQVVLNKLEYDSPHKIENPVQGIRYKYYEQNIESFSGMNSKLLREGISKKLHPNDVSNAGDHYQIIFEGYLKADTKGLYKFFLRSDDGSRLYINDKLIVDNDGRHDSSDEKIGEVALDEGYQKIRVEYFEAEGDDELILEYTLDNISRTKVTGENIFIEN
ncbi:MAG: hypothetical protein SCALA702_31180 [Melioribacteraceae bacterium]|nr:MAG: hypothetical protein SCALA702_31180 [Melioribacteraceae bacterium]